jgi:plastocyanin
MNGNGPRRERTTRWIAGAGVAALALASAAIGGTDAAIAQIPAEETVAIQLFQFKPSPVVVKAGAKVTWTNRDQIEHTVTSGAPATKDGRFDATLDGSGATFSTTFSERGTYPYFCNRHNSMVGEVRVN